MRLFREVGRAIEREKVEKASEMFFKRGANDALKGFDAKKVKGAKRTHLVKIIDKDKVIRNSFYLYEGRTELNLEQARSFGLTKEDFADKNRVKIVDITLKSFVGELPEPKEIKDERKTTEFKPERTKYIYKIKEDVRVKSLGFTVNTATGKMFHSGYECIDIIEFELVNGQLFKLLGFKGPNMTGLINGEKAIISQSDVDFKREYNVQDRYDRNEEVDYDDSYLDDMITEMLQELYY